MPWNEVSTMPLRHEFVLLASQEGANFRALCRDFNVAPNTGYKWLRRFIATGDAGLADRSRRPITTLLHTDAELEQRIVLLRHLHPAWGARKFKRRLEDLGLTLPAVSTVHAVLTRHGLSSLKCLSPGQLWAVLDILILTTCGKWILKGTFPTAKDVAIRSPCWTVIQVFRCVYRDVMVSVVKRHRINLSVHSNATASLSG